MVRGHSDVNVMPAYFLINRAEIKDLSGKIVKNCLMKHSIHLIYFPEVFVSFLVFK